MWLVAEYHQMHCALCRVSVLWPKEFLFPHQMWCEVLPNLWNSGRLSWEVSLLRLGDVDPLGRSGLSADAAIRRMHTNLAHASVADMQRMLMAARAPQPILDAFERFSCAQCDAMTAPKIPRSVSVPQTVAPLRYVAMDVKWLPGWEEDVRIKSVNIVDEASNLHHIYPFCETETSEILLRLYRQWTRAYGRPRWLKVDATGTKFGRNVATSAWGWRYRTLGCSWWDTWAGLSGRGARVLAQIRPSSRTEWLECIYQTMEAKNSLTRGAVWMRGTEKGAPGKQRRAQWRGPPRQLFFVSMPVSVIKAAPQQLRHRTAEEQETDRVVLRDLRRTADVLRASGSAKNYEDITEQDWPHGDLNPTAEGMELNQETPENQLPSGRFVRKTPPLEVHEKHPDPRKERVGQTSVDAPLQHELPKSMEKLDVRQPTVELKKAPCLPVLEPISNPTKLSEATEPRAKQPRIGERLRQFDRSVNLWKILKKIKRNWCWWQQWHLSHILGVFFLLVPGEKFIHPFQNGPLPQVVSSLHKESRLKRTCWFVINVLLCLFLSWSLLSFPRRELSPLAWFWWKMWWRRKSICEGTSHCKRRSGPRTLVPCQEPTNECSGFNERQSGYSAGHSLFGSWCGTWRCHWSILGVSAIESARWQTFPSSAIWWSSGSPPSTTPVDTFTVVWFEL